MGQTNHEDSQAQVVPQVYMCIDIIYCTLSEIIMEGKGPCKTLLLYK